MSTDLAPIPVENEAEAQIDLLAKEWIQEQVDKEVKRIRDVGSSVLPLKIINCGLVPNFDQKKARGINRVELDTTFDISKIQQVMVSPATNYPHKPHFSYVNLILVTNQPIPFIAPYLYQTNFKTMQPEKEEDGRKFPSKEVVLKNDLREFLFINKKGAVLRRQFNASPFVQNKDNRKPLKLAIFDFDSTLFLSPQLSPTIWHNLLVNAIINEDELGPGWWRDIRSLQFGKELQETAWKGYWNENVVKEARKAIKDPNTMAIVLTGRRYHPFHQVIPLMLEAKSLHFDLIGLRPDPEQEHSWKWTDGDVLVYNPPSVFSSTMQFKQRFINHLLQQIPSIREIVMWDDRKRHVHVFSAFLEALQEKDVLDRGHVKHVHAVLPKYNPTWERNVVEQILTSHNKILEERQLPRYIIVPIPTSLVILLDKKQISQLKKVFTTHYKEQCKRTKPGIWAGEGAEQPEFFGNHVVVSSTLNQYTSAFGKIGNRYDIRAMAVSQAAAGDSLSLQVQLKEKNEHTWSEQTYILPLWYRPSVYRNITTLPYHWRYLSMEKQVVLHGTLEHAYHFGMESLNKSGVHKLGDLCIPEEEVKLN
ncbi:hypothetical protein EC973_002322 [Apophysomyces ossiformis]|uniref:Swiss Army Knife RNA repair protein HAD domain-containing protein n=1 Tax=Apophysomyces ossiformis TaxID=679940 RepID=A0A8H7BGU2_9FUNG|nr:hypothetical protein EC973_002322 [Apophysomyces ossiformis]